MLYCIKGRGGYVSWLGGGVLENCSITWYRLGTLGWTWKKENEAKMFPNMSVSINAALSVPLFVMWDAFNWKYQHAMIVEMNHGAVWRMDVSTPVNYWGRHCKNVNLSLCRKIRLLLHMHRCKWTLLPPTGNLLSSFLPIGQVRY